MAISANRSPNYPSMSLGDSIEAIRGVYAKERRAKFPRSSLAAHLGYSSLNGRALSKIGAIRAYGLIDGREDAISVSPTAIALLEAPKDSEDYIQALHEAFNSPPLFGRILAEHEEQPSPETLRWWLAKQGYAGDAADKALKVYLASLDLINSHGGAYESGSSEPGPAPRNALAMSAEDMVRELMPFPKPAQPKPAAYAGGSEIGLAMGVHERVLTSGLLSKQATFRVVVSGPVGEAEIDRLLRKLEMDKEILADPQPAQNVDPFSVPPNEGDPDA